MRRRVSCRSIDDLRTGASRRSRTLVRRADRRSDLAGSALVRPSGFRRGHGRPGGRSCNYGTGRRDPLSRRASGRRAAASAGHVPAAMGLAALQPRIWPRGLPRVPAPMAACPLHITPSALGPGAAGRSPRVRGDHPAGARPVAGCAGLGRILVPPGIPHGRGAHPGQPGAHAARLHRQHALVHQVHGARCGRPVCGADLYEQPGPSFPVGGHRPPRDGLGRVAGGRLSHGGFAAPEPAARCRRLRLPVRALQLDDCSPGWRLPARRGSAVQGGRPVRGHPVPAAGHLRRVCGSRRPGRAPALGPPARGRAWLRCS